jgi:predicted transcriptional regulator of viral defense system
MDKNLEKMLYFTNEDLTKSVNRNNVNMYLTRRTKNGDILRLKRGIYLSAHTYNELKIHREINPYIDYLATNVLVAPSYLSLEYVLFKYQIIIENVYTFTAITTKKPANVQNVF